MMIARGFRPVVWVFMIGVAVLGCYMLNLRVASERAELAKLDRRIVATQQSIRALQTEVGTRSRIPQLEEWNEDVLALSAPASGQYLAAGCEPGPLRHPPAAALRPGRGAAGLGRAGDVPRPDAIQAPAATVTPAPQRAIAPAPVAARPEVRRASLLIAPEASAPTSRAPPHRPAAITTGVVRIAARDESAPGRATSGRDRQLPVTIAPGPGPADSAPPGAGPYRRPDERRPAPARATVRAAAAPGAAGRSSPLSGRRASCARTSGPTAAGARATDGHARSGHQTGTRAGGAATAGARPHLSPADAGDAALRRRHPGDRRPSGDAADLHRPHRQCRAVDPLLPARGDIVDRNGVPLARTIDAWAIALRPRDIIGDRAQLAQQLARLMPERTAQQYRAMLSIQRRTFTSSPAARCPSWCRR